MIVVVAALATLDVHLLRHNVVHTALTAAGACQAMKTLALLVRTAVC